MDLATSTPADIDTALRQLTDEHAAASAAADRFQIAVTKAAKNSTNRHSH